MQVTIIGGGSYQWTPELLADLMGTESLRGARLVLEDIDPTPLPKMAALAAKVDEALGAGFTIETTTDQRRALEGADFVIVTISTGGFESMSADLEVPARFGIRQSVGDTVGPGGINRGLRNIPVLLGVGRDMEQVCPDAWLLNITNPMTVLTRVVSRETSIKVAGLCHEVGNWCIDLALALGKPGDAVRPKVAGVNHFPVIVELDVDGQDGLAILRQMIEEAGGLDALAPVPGRPAAEPFTPLDFARRHVLALTLLDRFGAVPAAGDRHLAEFLPSVLTETTGWGAAFNIGLTTIEQRQAHQKDYRSDVDAWLSGDKVLQTWFSGELPAPVIDSLLTGTPRELPLNLANRGQCPDLPPEAVVESICVVDGAGIRGRDEAVMPPALAELVRRTVATQELTVEAAVRGDPGLARAAFALDPLGGRVDIAEGAVMADELLGATAKWLEPALRP